MFEKVVSLLIALAKSIGVASKSTILAVPTQNLGVIFNAGPFGGRHLGIHVHRVTTFEVYRQQHIAINSTRNIKQELTSSKAQASKNGSLLRVK